MSSLTIEEDKVSKFLEFNHLYSRLKLLLFVLQIISIASAHGLVASPLKSAYVAAKHGTVGFTKTVALEVAEYGADVNAIDNG